MCIKKDHIWNPSSCVCKIDKYLNSIIGDSVVIRDESINVVAKSYDKPTNLNEKNPKKQAVK